MGLRQHGNLKSGHEHEGNKRKRMEAPIKRHQEHHSKRIHPLMAMTARSYLFVPLTIDRDDLIDWRMPNLSALLGLSFLALWFFRSVNDYITYMGSWPHRRLETWELYCGASLLAASFITAKIRLVPPQKGILSPDSFEKHFLV
jgi:hypothetical protein